MTIIVNLRVSSVEMKPLKSALQEIPAHFMKFKSKSLRESPHLGGGEFSHWPKASTLDAIHILAHSWGTPVNSSLRDTDGSAHLLRGSEKTKGCVPRHLQIHFRP